MLLIYRLISIAGRLFINIMTAQNVKILLTEAKLSNPNKCVSEINCIAVYKKKTIESSFMFRHKMSLNL